MITVAIISAWKEKPQVRLFKNEETALKVLSEEIALEEFEPEVQPAHSLAEWNERYSDIYEIEFKTMEVEG
jgi:hypothetical protein